MPRRYSGPRVRSCSRPTALDLGPIREPGEHLLVDPEDPVAVGVGRGPRVGEAGPGRYLALEVMLIELRIDGRRVQRGVGEAGVRVDAQLLELRSHSGPRVGEAVAAVAAVACAHPGEVVVAAKHLTPGRERETAGLEHRLRERNVRPH